MHLIIGGVRRCGTSLAARLLAAQEGATFITTYLGSFQHLADSLGVDFDHPLDSAQRRAALLKVREELLRLRHPLIIGADEFRTLGDLYRCVLEDLTAVGDALVGHKDVLDPARIERLLRSSEMRVLILLRDPRDAAVSWWYRTGAPAESYIEDWKEMACYLGGRQHPHLFVARFEDLVTNPASALSAIVATAGIQFRLPPSLTSLTDMRDGAQPWSANTAYADVTRVVDVNAVGRWRSMRWSPLVRYAGWSCAAEMRELGYPCDPAPFSTAERRRFAIARCTHRLATLLTRGSRRVTGAMRRRVGRIPHRPEWTGPPT